MSIGAPNLDYRSVEAIEKSLSEILNLGLQANPPKPPMLLDDLFHERLKEVKAEMGTFGLF
jgi:hypothetical protein